MRRQSKNVLAAVLLLGSTACFTDPAESLRNGPDHIELEFTAGTILAGGSGSVQFLVRDAQGNILPIENVSWTSANPAIATAEVDTTVRSPGNLFARGLVKAPATGVGPTTVTVSANGLTADVKILVLPTAFPGTVANGGGNLMDTITVNSGASASFTTSGANITTVSLGGDALFIVSRTATTIKAIAQRGGSSPVTVTNVVIAGVTIPSLTTTGNVTVNAAAGPEPGEPANDGPGGVTIPVEGSSVTNPIIIHGTVSDASDIDDLFTFTTTATGPLSMRLEFFGTGAGGSTNPDLDLLLCNAGCTAFAPGGTAGATAANPEIANIAALAAGTYNVWVNAYNTGGATFSYRLTVRQ